MNQRQSYERKLDAVRNLLRQHDAFGVRLVSQRSVNWLTNIRSFINQATADSVAEVMVTLDEAWLVTNNIEGERIVQEELAGLPLELATFSWYESHTREQVIANLCGSSFTRLLSEAELLSELTLLQLVLDDWEAAELQELSQQTAALLEAVAREVHPGESEFEIAGRVSQTLLSAGIEPIVNLVAGDERAQLRRHPLPTWHSVAKLAMLVVCGRRRGLITSVTRSVFFGSLPSWLRARQEAVAYVDATALASSIPGMTLAGVLAKMQGAYAERGFPEEWRLHHQGGLTGYASRMTLAKPVATQVLQPGMAVAWNPTIAGVKSEDTCLVSTKGPVILSAAAGDWPYLSVEAGEQNWQRPWILERRVYTNGAGMGNS